MRSEFTLDGPTAVASLAMRDLMALLVPIAESEAPVVILGESGVGKNVVANYIHGRSARAGKPMVAVSCGGFPETLVEAELFGHERGAFTGAVEQRLGRFALADGGTLLLDEIGELGPGAQVKLLRVLETGTFEPLGTNQTVEVDVRVLSATHRDLRQLVADGRFREDLYYRLRVLEVRVPVLRERREDIPLIVAHLLSQLGQPEAQLTTDVWRLLTTYPFPGNVRELLHAVEHGLVMASGKTVHVHHLPPELSSAFESAEHASPAGPPEPLARAVRRFERGHVLAALRYCGGNRTRTAKQLGISRKNLWEKMRALAISPVEAASLGQQPDVVPGDDGTPRPQDEPAEPTLDGGLHRTADGNE